ncbi:Ig-like domain-containing protein [Akkermansiaceae bacterium]|nr:Ig-like domain-containing protein [Akkermansiaceae bacterium]
MNTTRSRASIGYFRKAAASAFLLASLALPHAAQAQTAHFMSTGDFSENFDDIADTAAWPNGFLSTEPWASVATDTTGTVPSATRITTSTATFSTGSSGGVQRGTQNIQLLSTGGNPGNTTSAAIDLLLDFTNRNAGTLSFDAATVFNGTGNREGEIKAYYTTDGIAWTEITGGGLPYTATNNLTGSAAVSVQLPAALDGAASARFRFYYYNKASVGTVSGSRPKISIDNLTVTSTAAGPDTTKPTLAGRLPAPDEPAAPIDTQLTITFSEPVVAGAGNVTLYAASAPSTPLQVFAASSGLSEGASVSFTPSAALAYETSYFVTVDATAFADAAGNTFDGISSPSGWAFTTAPEPAPVPPLIVSVTPGFNAVDVPLGDVSLEIEYDVALLRGSGTFNVFDIDDFDFPPTPVATYDVSDPAQVAITGSSVSFVTPFTGAAGKTYYIEAPAGLFLSVAGNVESKAFGFGTGDVYWQFQMETPDVTPPAIVSTSPQNGQGAASTSVLRVTYNEIVTLGAGPWTVTVFDVTAGQNLAVFTETDTASVSAAGTQLSITLPQALEFFNQYRVTLTEGIVRDAAGNISPEVAGAAWEFTTGAPFAAGQVVISQVYGGGGNASAQFTNDFIELYNTTANPISLSGWSVQYASATGTTWSASNLEGVIQSGGYFLVQLAAGLNNTLPPSEPLPIPDSTGTLALSGTNGKVALSNSITPLSGSNPASDPAVSDLVGYGTANGFEGTAAASGLSNTTAAIRKVAGSQDTNDNAADFTTGPPAPRNSSSPPFIPGADGSGSALASNATAGSALLGSGIFPSMASGQTLKIDLSGTFPGATLTDVEIDIPSGFGVPNSGNLTLSGPAAGSGSATANGQTISVSGVVITQANPLSIAIGGLSVPDISMDPNDAGTRSFTIRTASGGGTLTAIVASPSVRVAMPVADIATLRAVTLPTPKAYLIGTEAIVTYVESGNFRNQHYIQDATAGILIDDQPVRLGASYLAGNGLSNLVGGLTSFGGILQFTPVAATASVTSTGNAPAPAVVSLADFMASPDTYQSQLVRVNGITFQDATGAFANNGTRVLVQGADTGNFRTFFNAEYTGTAPPAGTFDMIAIARRTTDGSAGSLSPRQLADFITGSPPAPDYQDFADNFAGGPGPLLDFDNDGVPNGLEYLFGVSSGGFTPTPQIANGEISWPIDPTRTDVGFIVETSSDLVNWDPVLIGDLDLSDPNTVRYVVPSGTDPFFVRIGATFP